MSAPSQRLQKLLSFCRALDRLKTVERRSPLMDNSRRENSAEHSWHAGIAALLLAEYAADPIDVNRVVSMLLMHDVIEIEAGDTFCYDEAANRDKEERERIAAEKLFGLLPDDASRYMRTLWEEFEGRKTPESLFANAVDRFQALQQNYNAQGGTWREYDIPKSKVLKRMAAVKTGAPRLWDEVVRILDRACAMGFLRDDTKGKPRHAR